MGRQFLGRDLLEAVLVLYGHGDVDVVVPGNESLVAHRAQQRSAVEPVFDMVLLADAVDLLQYLQLAQLAGAEVLSDVLLEIFLIFFHSFVLI